VQALAHIASSYQGRKEIARLSRTACFDAIVAVFASTRDISDREIAAKMLAECGRMVYLLVEPQQTQEAYDNAGAVPIMHEAGILHALLAAIQQERAGTEPTGPAVLGCLAALFRLLTAPIIRGAMLATRSEHERAYHDFCELVSLIHAPHSQMALYGVLIVGKLLSDGLVRSVCRDWITRTDLVSKIMLALHRTHSASLPLVLSTQKHEQKQMRAALVHVLAALSNFPEACEAIMTGKYLAIILSTMMEEGVVECLLKFDDADGHAKTSLPASDFAVTSASLNQGLYGSQIGPETKAHIGPFTLGWYGGEMPMPPLLSPRSDCLYILYNMATLDFSGAAPASVSPRSVEKMIKAVLKVADDDADCCDLQTLIMMQTLEQLLTPVNTCVALCKQSKLILDTIQIGTIVGTQLLQVISADCKMSDMSWRASSGVAASDVASEGCEAGHDSPLSAAGGHTNVIVAGKYLSSSQGLFTLQAAVSALLCVCRAGCEAAVPALRMDPNFLQFAVNCLSVFSESTHGADAMQKYLNTLVLPDSAFSILERPMYADLMQHRSLAKQALSGDQLQLVSREVYARLIARLRGNCIEMLMLVAWSCLPCTDTSFRPPGDKDSIIGSIPGPRLVRLHGSTVLPDALMDALLKGIVPARFMSRKVLVTSLVAAGAGNAALELMSSPTADTLAFGFALPHEKLRDRTCALNVLIAILMREACFRRDTYLHAFGVRLLAALPRLMLTLDHSSTHSSNNAHTRAFCTSVGALAGVLCMYHSSAAEGLYEKFLHAGIRDTHLMPLLSTFVNRLVGTADMWPTSAATMMLQFLRTISLSMAGCRMLRQALGDSGFEMLRSHLHRLRQLNSTGTQDVQKQIDLVEHLFVACSLSNATAAGDGEKFPESPVCLHCMDASSCASDLRGCAEGSGLTSQETDDNLRLAKDILLRQGRILNLTKMAGQIQYSTLLRVAKNLATAQLGTLSRYAPGSILQLDFASLTPLAFTVEKQKMLRDVVANLLSNGNKFEKSYLTCFPKGWRADF
jgi:hypothetical protein